MTFRVRQVGEIVEPEDAFFKTAMEKETFSFTWEIGNFPELTENLYSPVFTGGPNEWKLQVQPCYKKKSSATPEPQVEEFIVILLFLHKIGTGAEDVKVDFQISILDSGRKILKTITTGQKFGKTALSCGWDQFFLRSVVLKEFLCDGHKLRIHCEIQSYGEFKHETVSVKPADLENSGQNSKLKSDRVLNVKLDSLDLQKKMMSFLTQGKFSDVTLKTENEAFPCYKVILSAHSPVFEAMFDSGMIESSENIVEIKDFSPAAVQGMIQFLCTGETQIMEENPGELLSISDKYQISGLKEKCEGILLKKLSVESAANTLILAHLHSPQILKPHVIYFINRFKKQVVNTEGYKEMVKEYPVICSELYASLES